MHLNFKSSTLAVVLTLAGFGVATAQEDVSGDVRLAAGWIETVIGNVAQSTSAIGEEAAAQLAGASPMSEDNLKTWSERSRTEGATTLFQTWPGGALEPEFQAAYPGLYSYGGAALTTERAGNLVALNNLTPVVRAAYRSFDYSWVYFTSADGLQIIYPFVPMDQGANDDDPTGSVYYQAANFDDKAVGWTAPYLDLVGAGMMITASYPVYGEGDALLGVASRDITLDEFSSSVLRQLTDQGDKTALLVDANGLAIAASDPAMITEIDAVNTAANSAVLYYRDKESVAEIPGAQPSDETWANAAVEHVITKGELSFDIAGRAVHAAAVPSTGWFVVLIEAVDG